MNEYDIQAGGGCDPKWTLEMRMTDPWILSFTFKYFSFKFSFQLKLSSPPLCEREDLRIVLAGDTKRKSLGPWRSQGRTSSGVLTLAQTGSWGLMVNICQLCIQWYHIGSLKLANIGECIPQKLANTINQRLFPPLWNPVVKYLPAQHCLWPKNSSYLLPTYLTYNAETGMGHNRYTCSKWETGEEDAEQSLVYENSTLSLELLWLRPFSATFLSS